MSKKSRKRNKKILGALAALGGAAMLANRRRNQANVELDLPKANTFSKPNMLDVAGKKIVNVPNPIPRLKVTDRGNVIKKGVDTGVGNMRTKFLGGDGKIFQGGKQVGEAGVTSPGISVREDGSIMSKGVLYPNRAAYMNRNKTTSIDRTPITFGPGNDGLSFFKSGGKVVKGETTKKAKKKIGIQIRGFGKARKK